jgi:hypothetical protein
MLRNLCAALLAVCLSLAPRPAAAQDPSPGAFAAGQRVEVEYTPGSGRWLQATVLEVLNDGYMYSVSITPGQGAAESRTNLHFRRVRAPRAAAPAPAPPAAGARPRTGRYGCTEAVRNTGGTYDFQARGAFVLRADGRYQYLGFRTPSAGRYTVGAGGRIGFAAGHLDGGEATPIEGQPGRFYLTAPRTGARWTCGYSAPE